MGDGTLMSVVKQTAPGALLLCTWKEDDVECEDWYQTSELLVMAL